MANTKITELTTTASANGSDLFVIITDTATTATTKNIQIAGLFGNVNVNTAFKANVSINNTSSLTVGNSTVNSTLNQSSLILANSTVQTNVTNLGISSGSVSVNNLGVYIGSNTIANAYGYFSGNNSSNLIANSTLLKFSNSTSTSNLTIAGLKVGLSTVNISGIYVGANMSVNSTSFKIGDGTVNVFTNSSTIMVGSNVIVNTTTVSLGSESRANATTITVGNSSVNSTIIGSSIKIVNSTSNIAMTIPTTTQYAATNIFLHANSSWTTPEEHMIVDVSRDETTSIAAGTNKYVFYAPYAMTLTKIPKASLTTNSSSGSVTLDLNEAGVSILSTLLTIDANEATSDSAATPAVLSDTTIVDNARVSIDIDDAGTGAKGLKVTLYYRRT
jgi:hypothetical protein